MLLVCKKYYYYPGLSSISKFTCAWQNKKKYTHIVTIHIQDLDLMCESNVSEK